jgi:hypothetical protein
MDVEHEWLPDRLTWPLLVAGLAAAWGGFGPPLESRLIGAAAGFAALFLIARLYSLLRGREGLGGGDPKLFAAIGAWLGWTQLPFVLVGGGAARPRRPAPQAAARGGGRGHGPASARHPDGARRLADLDCHQPVIGTVSQAACATAQKLELCPGWRILGWMVAKTLLYRGNLASGWRGEGI